MKNNENAKGLSNLVFARSNALKGSNLSIMDFALLKVLGRGAFGKVLKYSSS